MAEKPKTHIKSETESDSPSCSTQISPQITTGFSSLHPKTTTLPSSSSSSSSTTTAHCDSGNPSFYNLLQGVMAKNLGFQGPNKMSHQEALATVTAKAAKTHAPMQLQPEPGKIATLKFKDCKQESSEKKSSTQSVRVVKFDPLSLGSVASTPSPMEKVDKQDVKLVNWTPKSDGYSWRKYGQKQVKSSGSSRSYYRCTHYQCVAKKKVQHLDLTGQIIEVVYKGDHSHDPPQNLKDLSQKRDALSAISGDPNDNIDTLQKSDDQSLPTCGREVQQGFLSLNHDRHDESPDTSACTSKSEVRELKMTKPDPTHRNEAVYAPAEGDRCRSRNTEELAMTDPLKELDLAPLKKRRTKETGEVGPDIVYRTFKEPKVVVHAAEDAGTSSDGYRWRKYGQKMVKGSPHPRSYYRCSSSGCPVRKHVERSTDNSASFIVTYEGRHDHDKPVPRKRHGSPNSPISPAPALATPADKPRSEKPETKSQSPNQEPPTQQSKDVNGDVSGEKTSDVGADKPPTQQSKDVNGDVSGEKTAEVGDKVLESARTLLSIGIELKSC